jgi:hypothetical protein
MPALPTAETSVLRSPADFLRAFLLIVDDHAGRRFVDLNPPQAGHLLDLRRLFFQAGGESFDFRLLLRDCRFLVLQFTALLLDLAVFFKKLVEQLKRARQIQIYSVWPRVTARADSCRDKVIRFFEASAQPQQ